MTNMFNSSMSPSHFLFTYFITFRDSEKCTEILSHTEKYILNLINKICQVVANKLNITSTPFLQKNGTLRKCTFKKK